MRWGSRYPWDGFLRGYGRRNDGPRGTIDGTDRSAQEQRHASPSADKGKKDVDGKHDLPRRWPWSKRPSRQGGTLRPKFRATELRSKRGKDFHGKRKAVTPRGNKLRRRRPSASAAEQTLSDLAKHDPKRERP